ncbi:AMP-binding protein [Novosphingobium sp.]|uniref:AMP-binding protein n=1 Tax=Novosphingobium sp. TaxID=1874826 RepID=UPI0038B81AB7
MTQSNDNAMLRLGVTVAEMQAGALRLHADKTALVAGDLRITCGELDAKVAQYARLFKAHGLKRGDGFSILATNRIEVIFANLAGQVLGMRYTPLHPKGSEDDHLYILDHAEISALLVDDLHYTARGKVLGEKAGLKALFTIDGTFGIPVALADGMSAEPIDIEAQPGDISQLLFTGGTTGRPKGVVHRHASIVTAYMQSLTYWDWPDDIRFLIATPISHAAGAMLTPTLMRGGEFHVMAGFDPKAFLETVERERITATFVVPSMIYDLLDKVRVEDYDLSSLEMIIYGAAPISPARLAEAIERIGPKFCQLYGQTESPNMITYLSRADHDLARPHLLQSCGVPLAPNRITLRRPDGSEAGPDEAGEICMRGPLIMDSYWKNPEETEKTFAGGWLHTGDVAKRDDAGYLYIVDRVKDMVISGGFNIFTREVEDCLSQHPAIAACAVIGIPHPRWGEAVAAYVVLKDGFNTDSDELIALVRDKKGPVQAPKSVDFVSALPLTAVGKVDKKVLRERHWQGAERGVA